MLCKPFKMYSVLHNLNGPADANKVFLMNVPTWMKTCLGSSVSVCIIDNDIMFSISNSFATYYDAYLLTMDMLQEIGIHHTLPRSPCFSINLNSFFVATLSNTWLWRQFYFKNCADYFYLCFDQWSIIRKHGSQSLTQSPKETSDIHTLICWISLVLI